MAGGPFAEYILCMACAEEGVVLRAERVHEGVETDHYVCPEGHGFGVEWRRGPATAPQWPPPPGELAAIEAMREPPAPRNLVPDTTVRRFVHGAATSPGDALLAWLTALPIDGGSSRLRLPAVLSRGQVGFSLHDARIGGGPDALTIRCDDSPLGVGLAERARQACGDAPTCALWLEGHWRGGDERCFVVVKAGAPIPADALAAADAEIEASDGDPLAR